MTKRKSKSVPPCRPVKGRPANGWTENRLSRQQRAGCANAARELSGGFAWCESAEGYDFWDAVYERLIEISEGAPLK